MGGRGTFASGNQVPFTYKTIGFIEDAKILEGISSKYHKLPEEAHSSEKYIKLNPVIAECDDIRQIRAIGYNFWKNDGVYSQDFYISVLKQNLSLVYKVQRYTTLKLQVIF